MGGLDHFNLSFLSVNTPILPLPHSIGGKENCGKMSKVVEFLKQLQIFLKGKKAGNSSVVVYGAY